MHGTWSDPQLVDALPQLESDWTFLRQLWANMHSAYDTIHAARVAYMDSRALLVSLPPPDDALIGQHQPCVDPRKMA
jgi:hypothetical protein